MLHNSVKHAHDELKIDVKAVLCKLYSNFFQSAKRTDELKSYFDFVESDYPVSCFARSLWKARNISWIRSSSFARGKTIIANNPLQYVIHIIMTNRSVFSSFRFCSSISTFDDWVYYVQSNGSYLCTIRSSYILLINNWQNPWLRRNHSLNHWMVYVSYIFFRTFSMRFSDQKCNYNDTIRQSSIFIVLWWI